MEYKCKPVKIKAFQFFPNKEIPDWFIELIETGKAMVIINEHKKTYVTMKNKRTRGYIGFVGDWVIMDEFGLVEIRSKKTFEKRYEAIN